MQAEGDRLDLCSHKVGDSTCHVPVATVARYFSLKGAGDDSGAWASQGVQLALQPCRCAVASAHANEVAVFSLSGSYADEGCGVVLGRGPVRSPRPVGSYPGSRTHGSAAGQQANGGQHQHGQQSPTLLGASLAGADTITCLQWVPLTPDTPEQPSRGPSSSQSYYIDTNQTRKRQHASSAEAESAGQSAWRCPGCGALVVLLVGTSAGYLQVHDPWGQVMLRQRLHAHGSAVKHMQLTRLLTAQEPQGPTRGWDVTITLAADSVVRVRSQDLAACIAACSAARQAAAASQQSQGGGAFSAALAWATSAPAPIPTVPPLVVSRWELPRSLRGPRSGALCVGPRPPDLYSVLQGGGGSGTSFRGSNSSTNTPGGQGLVIATCGERPALAALDAQSAARRGALSAVVGAARAVAAGVMGVATTAISMAGAPAAVAQGLRSFIVAPLFTAPAVATSSQPLACYDEVHTGGGGQQAGKPEAPPAPWRSIQDDMRLVTSLVLPPSGPWAAAPDSLGRVSLLDLSHFGMLRMWKGYRDAQVGWLTLPTRLVAQVAEGVQGGRMPATLSVGRGPLEPAGCHTSTGNSSGAQSLNGQHISAADQPGSSPRSGGQQRDRLLLGTEPTQTHRGEPQGQPKDEAQGRHDQVTTTTTLLVLHAPRRRQAELWLVPHGPRLLSLALPHTARWQLHYLPAATGEGGTPGTCPPDSEQVSQQQSVSVTWTSSAAVGDTEAGRVPSQRPLTPAAAPQAHCSCLLLDLGSGALHDIADVVIAALSSSQPAGVLQQ